jgi:hypothetical protein
MFVDIEAAISIWKRADAVVTEDYTGTPADSAE